LGAVDGQDGREDGEGPQGRVPKDTWIRRHLQLIQFGRDHCPALHHDLDACPICGWAATAKRKKLEADQAAELKAKRRKTS